jgi:hypothetical protein
MSYSDFTHFSDRKPYKILFIPSYDLKDMNFASLEQLQQFSGKMETSRKQNNSHRGRPGAGSELQKVGINPPAVEIQTWFCWKGTKDSGHSGTRLDLNKW